METTNGNGELAKADELPSQVLEVVTAGGDLGRLTPNQQAQYILALCKSIGLNPLSRPIELIKLNNRIVPYAKKDCCDQLRKRDRISIQIISKEVNEGVLTVTARATTPDGRVDEDCGSVVVSGLKGDALANSMMKGITKAKRRVTLSISGLGFLEESELDTIPSAEPVPLTLPATSESSEQLIERVKGEMSKAPTMAELRAIGDEIRKANLPDTVKLELSKTYKSESGRIQEMATANVVKISNEFGGKIVKPGEVRTDPVEDDA